MIATTMSEPFSTASDEADGPLDPLAEAALQWQVRLNSGTADTTEKSAYGAWKNSSARHRRAAERAEELWRQIGHAGVKAGSRRARTRPRATRAWAAGLAAAAIGAALWLGLSGAWAPGAYRTGTGDVRTVRLDDGSVLELDAGTAIKVDFSDARRHVVVRRGQVYVKVAPDAARPFDLEAAGGTTRALGTAFNVRYDGRNVEVAVTEHAVSVRTSPQQGERVIVQAGQAVRYGEDHQPGPATATDIGVVTAWRRGYLVFENEPLASVMRRVSRHRHGLILIDGKALRALPLTGVFRAADTDALLEALPQSLPVRVRRWPGLILIEPAR